MGFVKAALGFEEKRVTGSFDTQAHEEWLRRNGYLDSLSLYDDYTARRVSVSGALEASAVLACTKILGEDTGSLPFQFFRRDPRTRETQQARDDWRWGVLHGMANEDMASGEFVEALTASAALTGDAFADIEYYDQGRRAFLWPRDSNTVTLIHQERRRGTSPSRVFYEVEKEGRKTSREIFHLRGFTFNGAQGDAILKRARRVLGLTLTAQEYAGRHFSQGVHADLFLEHPAGGPEIVENIEKAYQKKQGAAKAGTPFVLTEGMRARRVPPDLRRQQLLEARHFQLLEVCRLWRIQPHKLSDLSRATFNNIEELQIDHVVNTLGPWRRRWSEAVRRHLLTPEEQTRQTVYAEHQVEALLRGNFEQQTEGWSKLILAGVYSINEVRRWLNLNPVEGGDAHRVQMQMQDVQQVANEVVKMMRAA